MVLNNISKNAVIIMKRFEAIVNDLSTVSISDYDSLLDLSIDLDTLKEAVEKHISDKFEYDIFNKAIDDVADTLDEEMMVSFIVSMKPNHYLTIDDVSNYFNVDKETIRILLKNNPHIFNDGVVEVYGDIFDYFEYDTNRIYQYPLIKRKVVVDNDSEIDLDNMTYVLNLRTIINLGMMLEDNGVAQTLRSYVFDILQN